MLIAAKHSRGDREILVIDLDDTSLVEGEVHQWPDAPFPSFALPGQRRGRWSKLWAILVLTPTLLATVYAYGYATDRFQTEARLVVRGAGQADSVGGMGADVRQILGGAGQDEGYIAKNFILSRDALHYLSARMPIDAMLQPPSWDPLFRFPTFLSSPTQEGAFKHYLRFVDASFQTNGNVLILRVEAFNAADAVAIANTLVTATEDLVNRLNRRPGASMVETASGEVERARNRAFAAQDALTAWRTRERMIDPTRMASAYVETIARLALELAQIRAQITEVGANSPRSPQLATLRARAAALAQQVEAERLALAGGDTGFVDRLSAYERLVLERSFSERSFEAALRSLEVARRDAEQQKLFVEQIVQASQPDWPLYPKRWLIVAVVLFFNILLFFIIRAIYRDTQSHADA